MTNEDAARAVVQRLRNAGFESYWAGGCVRDLLLGRSSSDIDVATNAPPSEITPLFRRTREVGAQFGVVLVRQGRHWIETATFRTDLDYHDGRRPDGVVFTTAREDAQRRDFTINGLFYDPLTGEVIDYVNGQADIRAGVVRAIGEAEQRFAEDHLRMLRAVRFAARLDFAIAPETADAIRSNASQITRISPERIWQELHKMLAHPTRGRSVRLLKEVGLLDRLPFGPPWSSEQVEHSAAVCDALPADGDAVLGLAALLHHQSPAQVRTAMLALRCSNQQIDDAAWLLERWADVNEASGYSLAAFKKLIAHPRIDDLLNLHAAVTRMRGRSIDANEAARQRRADIAPEAVAPLPLVTGEDLLARDIPAGPVYREVLDRLYDAQLNEEIMRRDEALALLKQCLAERGFASGD